MQPFGYVRADTLDEAVAVLSDDPSAAPLAGGTTQIDLLRLNVRHVSQLVDINRLPLGEIEPSNDGGLSIGALARMSDVAVNPVVREHWPMIARALELGASAQLRNMASIGGNILQAVRCGYFRDVLSPCNKRVPDSGCAAIGGVNRNHALLGTSAHCIATHPSDLAVALVAAEATIRLHGPEGSRSLPLADFFLLPGERPDREHALDRAELIIAIHLPPLPVARRSTYLKVRDRESYEFALTSVAAAIAIDRGRVTDARVALGGVATRPWRASRAETLLVGHPASAETYRAAAEAELADAVPQSMNGFKIELARRTIVRALTMLGDTE